MSFTVIIPARMKSTRLPEKPLKLIEGIPMVVRVAELAARTSASRVVVAADHPRILAACEAANVEALLTSSSHPTGTDRLSEAVSKLGLPDDEIVVNLQGDEPLMPTNVVEDVARLLAERPQCAMATAAHAIRDIESFMNPNVVKVTLDHEGNAITFSRAPIPWPRDAMARNPKALPENFAALHHLGLYAYRAAFLKRYPTLPQAPLEAIESLEQLRALYFGEKIAVMTLDAALPAGVDTQEDLERVRAICRAAKA